MNFLVRRADAVAAGIGWIEVGLLSVRIAGVSVGTRRGKIVDCERCLAVRMPCFVGYRVGSEIREKKKDLRIAPRSLIYLVGGRRLELRTPGL